MIDAPRWWSRDQREALAKYEQDPEWAIGFWLGDRNGCPCNGGTGEPAQPMLRQESDGGDDPMHCGCGWLHVSLESVNKTACNWYGQSLWVAAIKVVGQNDEKAWGKERIIIGHILPSDLPDDATIPMRVSAGELDFAGVNISCDMSWPLKHLDYLDLSDSNFRYTKAVNVNFRMTNLRNANFQGADLSNSNFVGANLSYANLRGANLNGANLSGAILKGTILENRRCCYRGYYALRE